MIIAVNFISGLVILKKTEANKSIGKGFTMVYELFITLFLVCIASIYFYVFMSRKADSPKKRSMLRIAFFVNSSINILLILWTLIYFCFIYKYDSVFEPIPGDTTSIEGDEWKKKYHKYNKGRYVFYLNLLPFVLFLVSLYMDKTVLKWVEDHKY